MLCMCMTGVWAIQKEFGPAALRKQQGCMAMAATCRACAGPSLQTTCTDGCIAHGLQLNITIPVLHGGGAQALGEGPSCTAGGKLDRE